MRWHSGILILSGELALDPLAPGVRHRPPVAAQVQDADVLEASLANELQMRGGLRRIDHYHRPRLLKNACIELPDTCNKSAPVGLVAIQRRIHEQGLACAVQP